MKVRSQDCSGNKRFLGAESVASAAAPAAPELVVSESLVIEAVAVAVESGRPDSADDEGSGSTRGSVEGGVGGRDGSCGTNVDIQFAAFL